MKTLSRVIFGMCIAIMMAEVHAAATVSLSPSTTTAPQNSQVKFNLLANFGSNPISILGGSIYISWDPKVLTYSGFVFKPPVALLRDSGFDINTLQKPGLLSFGFGKYDGITLTGPTLIGELTFNVVGTSKSATPIKLSDKVNAVNAGFISIRNENIPVTYSGATVKVIIQQHK